MVVFLVTLDEKYFMASLASSSLCLFYEIFCLLTNPKQYFSSYENWLDLFGHIGGISWILVRINIENREDHYLFSGIDRQYVDIGETYV